MIEGNLIFVKHDCIAFLSYFRIELIRRSLSIIYQNAVNKDFFILALLAVIDFVYAVAMYPDDEKLEERICEVTIDDVPDSKPLRGSCTSKELCSRFMALPAWGGTGGLCSKYYPAMDP